MRPTLLSGLLLVLASLPTSARAGWIPDGVPVCTNPAHQSSPVTCPDGAGGAYIAWLDGRNSPPVLSPWSQETDVYLQRLAPTGDPAPGWPVDGIPVCTVPGYQGNVGEMAITPDGFGGVFLMWTDSRDNPGSGDLYAQRITAAGTIAPGWPLNGFPVCTAPDWQDGGQLAPDGAGGVFAVWRDQRKGDTNERDTYALHLTGAGTIATGWPVNGLALDATTITTEDVAILADGAGGAFFSYYRGAGQLVLQRRDGAGQPAPGWPAAGVVACQGPGGGIHSRLVHDGAGGVIAAWADIRTDQSGDLYAARVSGAGIVDPAWPANGAPVAVAPSYQGPPGVVEDGHGGALLAWSDYRNNLYEIFAQHLTGAGTTAPGWPASGLLACTANAAQELGGIVGDGMGGAFLTYQGGVNAGGIDAQHLTGSGAPAPGWAASGANLRVLGGGVASPRIAPVPGGGAIVAWADDRGPGPASPYDPPNPYDIYASMIGVDGPVPVLATLVSAELRGSSATIVWQVSGAGGMPASVERRADGGDWNTIGEASADGTDRFTFVDPALAPGHTYGYRLGYTLDGEQAYSPEAEIVVPAAALAIGRFAFPQPTGAIEMSITLASDAPARLELFDIGGRRIASRDVGSLGAGVHAIRITPPSPASGVLLARLRQGGLSASGRAIVVR